MHNNKGDIFLDKTTLYKYLVLKIQKIILKQDLLHV